MTLKVGTATRTVQAVARLPYRLLGFLVRSQNGEFWCSLWRWI